MTFLMRLVAFLCLALALAPVGSATASPPPKEKTQAGQARQALHKHLQGDLQQLADAINVFHGADVSSLLSGVVAPALAGLPTDSDLAHGLNADLMTVSDESRAITGAADQLLSLTRTMEKQLKSWNLTEIENEVQAMKPARRDLGVNAHALQANVSGIVDSSVQNALATPAQLQPATDQVARQIETISVINRMTSDLSQKAIANAAGP